MPYQDGPLLRQAPQVAILRLEKNFVAKFDTAHIGTNCNHFGPRETSAYLSGGWDHDATAGPALPGITTFAHQDSIVQKFDRHWAIFSGFCR